jgi:hypothetical protein
MYAPVSRAGVHKRIKDGKLSTRVTLRGFVYQPKRRRNGKSVKTELYRARVRFPGERKVRDIPLGGTEIDGKDNGHGRLDFHSFRVMYCTELAPLVSSERVRMELMRHHDPRLTAETYTDARCRV